MSRNLLVSGVSGFVGGVLLPRLCSIFDTVYALVRPQSIGRFGHVAAAHPNLQIVPADLSLPGIFSDESAGESLRSEVTDLLHMAAYYDMAGGLSPAYFANVVGTHNLLDYAATLPGLRNYFHLSTLAVAGDYEGLFYENMFRVNQGLPNAYAQTKFRSEALAGGFKTQARRRVMRLGIVVGDSRTGRIPKVDGPYYFLRALWRLGQLVPPSRSSTLLPLPFDPASQLYLIPVDTVARYVEAILAEPKDEVALKTYHIVGHPVGIEPFIRRSLKEAGFSAEPLPLPRNRAGEVLLHLTGIPAQTLHYFYARCDYDSASLKFDYPELSFPVFEDYADSFFQYAFKELIAGGRA